MEPSLLKFFFYLRELKVNFIAIRNFVGHLFQIFLPRKTKFLFSFFERPLKNQTNRTTTTSPIRNLPIVTTIISTESKAQLALKKIQKILLSIPQPYNKIILHLIVRTFRKKKGGGGGRRARAVAATRARRNENRSRALISFAWVNDFFPPNQVIPYLFKIISPPPARSG